jgi:hypothetical protein
MVTATSKNESRKTLITFARKIDSAQGDSGEHLIRTGPSRTCAAMFVEGRRI